MTASEKPDPTLDQLQRWLQAAITNPAGVLPGLLSDEAQQQIPLSPDRLEEIILPSRRMSADERLAVYQRAYFARLIEALQEFFPCLSASLGEEVFAQFSVGYLQQYPSQSYTLHRLADRFAAFLDETRPKDSSAAASLTGFYVDLARLELAIDRVFDAPGPERDPRLTFEQLTSISAERWPETRLKLCRGFELLRFDFPVGEYYSAWKQGESPAVPSPRPSFAALLRRDFVVRRFELTSVQHELLQSLAAALPVGEAIAQAAALESDHDALAANLQHWFRQWAAEGFFSGIEA